MHQQSANVETVYNRQKRKELVSFENKLEEKRNKTQ